MNQTADASSVFHQTAEAPQLAHDTADCCDPFRITSAADPSFAFVALESFKMDASKTSRP